MADNLFSHVPINGQFVGGVSGGNLDVAVTDDVEDAKDKLATDDVTMEQIMSIVALDVRGVDDAVVAKCVGLDEWLIRQVRLLDSYKSAISEQATAQVAGEIGVDNKWNKVEELSLDVLLDDLVSNGRSMDTVQLMTMAKQANAANRRTGVTGKSKNMPFGAAGGMAGVIDASNSQGTVVNLSFPTVLVNHLQQVINGEQVVATPDELEQQYADHSNAKFNMKSVSELLDVDLTKGKNDRQRPDELYMNAIELHSEDTGLVSEEAG